MPNTENNEKYTFDVVDTVCDTLPDKSDVLRIQISAWCDDLDDGGTLSIALMKYDSVANKFVPDATVRDDADKQLTELFGVGVDDIVANPSVILHASFEGYFNADNNRIYLTQQSRYISFDKLDTAGERAIRNLDFPIKSTPIGESKNHGISKKGEPYSIQRFEIGIEVEVKGETKCYRISQLKVESPDEDSEPTIIRMNYADRTADDKFAAVDFGRFADPDDARKNLAIAEKMTERNRTRTIDQFNQATGLDLESLIASGDGIEFQRVEVYPSGFGSYLVATIDNAMPF